MVNCFINKNYNNNNNHQKNSNSEERFYHIALIFLIFCVFLSNCDLDTTEEEETIIKEYLICRQCGQDASLTNFLLYKLSPVAIRASNETLFNNEQLLVQEVKNPFGVSFKIIILKEANCAHLDIWSSSDTWFPGYAWKHCFCPHCASLLGWMFEPITTATKSQSVPSENGFYAIILNTVIEESYVNSLLMKEKLLRDN